jgi:hypothetical protein
MFSIRSQGRVDIPRAAEEHRSSKSTSLGDGKNDQYPTSGLQETPPMRSRLGPGGDRSRPTGLLISEGTSRDLSSRSDAPLVIRGGALRARRRAARWKLTGE